VAATRLPDAGEAVMTRALCGPPAGVHLVNAYSLVCAHNNPDVAGALAGSVDVNFMDGMPLVWLARALGAGPHVSRVYGPDLMLDVLDRGRAHGLRHYLYGGTPDTLALLAERLGQRFPGVQIVGAEAPPFRALADDEVAAAQARIRAAAPHVVWVGLGTPKQDLVCTDWASACDAVMIGVGAAFDFHAGVKAQAPRWLRRIGLEWLFRLCAEPRRLARRYLLGNAHFLWLAARRTALHRPHVAGEVAWPEHAGAGADWDAPMTAALPRDGRAA
jgi:N-acetylglucosaminyldiphosphoundecaprenol N-acetyl-beta-D-mannosaminyltransferase